MINKMIHYIKQIFFTRRELLPNDEIHDLKNRLTVVSGNTTRAAREYKETMKTIQRRNDITFKIGVVTGNAIRN